MFSTLTNAYALIAVGASENFYRFVCLALFHAWFKGCSAFIIQRLTERRIFPDHSVFEAELQDVIPICRATIAGTRVVGRLTAG